MNNVISTTNLKLHRYAAVVATVQTSGRKFTGLKKAEQTALQQAAIDSWLACSSRVILLNMASDLAHLNTKGVFFEEKFASNPTVGTMLKVLSKNISPEAFGVVVDDMTILDPTGPYTLSGVRLRAQLSRAWGCTAMLDVFASDGENRLIGSDAWAFWMTGHIARYLADNSKNPPPATSGPEWVGWLSKEMSAKILGHRYFDATDLRLATYRAPEASYAKAKIEPIIPPFTKHA